MPKRLDLTGQRFERIAVLGFAGFNTFGKSTWRCRCDCGAELVCVGGNLKSGMSASCGCARVKHGLSRSWVYKIWGGMHQRCENKKRGKWHLYGGKGIKVCQRWRSFENFYADMGDPPSRRHTIERRDGSKDYEPTNCRWATRTEQARNMTRNRIIEFEGVRLCMAEWAERLGVKPRTLSSRLRRWPLERALRRC